jgi:hypothetical protein
MKPATASTARPMAQNQKSSPGLVRAHWVMLLMRADVPFLFQKYILHGYLPGQAFIQITASC